MDEHFHHRSPLTMPTNTARLPQVVVKNNLIQRNARPFGEKLAEGEALFPITVTKDLEWAPLTPQRWAKELSKGYTDPQTNLTYWLDDQSIFLRGGKLAMLNTALAAGAITPDTEQTIWDKQNQPHVMKTSEYIALILRMGAYYENLYAQYCP